MRRNDHRGRPRRRTGRRTARHAFSGRRTLLTDVGVVHEVLEQRREAITLWLADSFYRPSTALLRRRTGRRGQR